jgi:hypothetical protein
MNLSFESVQNALKLGKEFLPRVGAFELAEILGISKESMFALIDANRTVFWVDVEKNINITENKDNIFATTEDSFNFFLREKCNGDKKLAAIVQTKKGITGNVLAPIHWEKDFEIAFYVRMDPDKNGESSKASIANAEGNEMGERAVCLGRVAPGGTTPDKWIYGVIPSESEVADRRINGKHMYYHRWVQDDSNKVKWVIPSRFALFGQVTESKEEVKTETKTKKLRESKVKEEVPMDIPGQQKLAGTDPKPVETAPPASILKETPPPVEGRPPVIPMAAASIKADIKSRAIDEQAAAGQVTVPASPLPPALDIPKVMPIPKESIPVPPPATTPIPVAASPESAASAMGLLDSLLKQSNQS